jgi:RimJ/RimL family protein N-acetyltransferase
MEAISEPIEETERTLCNYVSSIYPLTELGHFGIFFRDTKELAGMAALYYGQEDFSDCVQLGYLVDEKYRHQGLALWACNALIDYARDYGLSRIICLIRPENFPSIRLAMRLGFQLEGAVTYQYFTHNLYALSLD